MLTLRYPFCVPETVEFYRRYCGPTQRAFEALSADRPKPRYPVTPSAHLMINQRRLMPDRVWDLMMRTQFPTPKG